MVNAEGEEPANAVFKLNWAITPGTLLLVSGILTMFVLRISPGRGIRAYGRTLNQLKWATLTVATVLGLAYVMNFSAQTLTLGQWIAGAGGVLGFLSAIIGWLGVAVTGSDTSSNALFGGLQVQAAQEAGLNPTLLAAANSSGGVLGKMISPAEPRDRGRRGGPRGAGGRPLPDRVEVEPRARADHVRDRSAAIHSDPLVDGRLAAAPEGPTIASGQPEADAPERDLRELVAELKSICGDEWTYTQEHQLRTYESDGLLQYRAIPAAAVVPGTAEEVQRVVQACAREEVPWVARGSGSGLSGGALPVKDGVLIVMSRMKRILEIDLENGRVCVEPGVTNSSVSAAVAPGFFYPPDPSSQIVCSIGGNVAENSGGAHCFKYGFTTNYVTGLELVLADGDDGPGRRLRARPARLRPARRVRRLRGHARRRDQGVAEGRPGPGDRAHAGGVLRPHSRGRRGRVRDRARAASSPARSR